MIAFPAAQRVPMVQGLPETSSSRTTGAAVFEVEWRSVVRLQMRAQDGRRAYGCCISLLYRTSARASRPASMRCRVGQNGWCVEGDPDAGVTPRAYAARSEEHTSE